MMMKPIRTEADYEAGLERVEALMDAKLGTPEADELEILASLIERYESDRFPIAAPTPLAAIQFRMEQEGLEPRDLEPFIGSRARVSEVLNGERPLSIDMIRALHRNLGIPADVLIQADPKPQEKAAKALSVPATKQLVAWGLMAADEAFSAFLGRAVDGAPAMAMLRKTRTERTNGKSDIAAIQAWCAAVLLRSREVELSAKYDGRRISYTFMRDLAKLSVQADGPSLALARLADVGIASVILPHLPGTHLDGAAMRGPDGTPIIALTLRHDRIDNFWFTLFHELAHVKSHLADGTQVILDDLEISSAESIEKEADDTARVALIPDESWEQFNSGEYASTAQLLAFAGRVQVHPAIVAGRWQKQNRDFRKFSKLLGHGAVRQKLASA
ncbi:MAG TPA: ImmA/IrrE family metallo-endopeptidase [Caulobacteraceae bacterium]|jgi:HTH-type transcriptional regulator/antitoxin HigA